MTLTPEQLEQCRKEYLLKFKLSINPETDSARWIGFQAAWRPIPSVDEIADILVLSGARLVTEANKFAQDIHRAFGGKE